MVLEHPGILMKTPHNPHYLANIRLVLLGSLDEGKRSVGNTILGKERFGAQKTAVCETKQGWVAGRQVTVTITPGWGRDQRLSQTPAIVQEQLLQSVFPPGVHGLLLVIRADKKFTEAHRVALQDHMELLGERVWDHTILLFTCGDWLGDAPIEQFIHSEGMPLQWVVGQCSHRVYRINNTDRADVRQVSKLLRCIAFVVAKNNVQHFELDSDRYQKEKLKLEGRERAIEEMRERIKQVMGMEDDEISPQQSNQPPSRNFSEGLKSPEQLSRPPQTGFLLPLQELRIILMGQRGAGKTAAGNTILESEAFKGRQSVQSVRKETQVAGRRITVVRASDWPKEQLLIDTPELTKQEIIQSLSMCPPGPHAVLVVINVRLKFTEASRRAVQEHLELLSEKVWNHCMALFTCEEWLGDLTIEQYIESEGKPLQWLIEKCGDRYHVLNYKSRRESSQVTELLQKIEHMVVGYGGSHFEPDSDTLSKMEHLRKVETEKAEKRRMAVERHRGELQTKLMYYNN